MVIWFCQNVFANRQNGQKSESSSNRAVVCSAICHARAKQQHCNGAPRGVCIAHARLFAVRVTSTQPNRGLCPRAAPSPRPQRCRSARTTRLRAFSVQWAVHNLRPPSKRNEGHAWQFRGRPLAPPALAPRGIPPPFRHFGGRRAP